MSALVLQITAAGRAALVNAQNNGTVPLLVSQIGITEQAFTAAPDGSDLALPGELKRLDTIAGDAVAADTIHVSITDASADVYSMYGFALYFDDGTLFALYGQADPIVEKSAQAMMLLACDAIFQTIDVANITFVNTDFALPPATTERSGIVELATSDETIAGADGTRAVPPSAFKAALDSRFGNGAPSAFVKTLLTAATALAFRTLLALKTASTYDIGAGKGLDADLLDGQHGAYYRAWANLTGVPASFPPSAHTHAWADITGAPAYATRWAAWDEVTGKPATFPPAAHSQDWSTILNIPATATRWPAWGEVTGKPVFAAVATSGSYADLANKPVLAAVAISGSYNDLANRPSLNFLPLSGGTVNGQLVVSNSLKVYGSDAGTNAVYFGSIANWLRLNGAIFEFSASVKASTFDTSDPRLKDALRRTALDRDAIDALGLWRWIWKQESGKHGVGIGVRSDEVRTLLPEFVHRDANGFDVVNHAQLGVVLGVAAHRRIRIAEDRADKAEARADGMARTLAELAERLRVLERTVTGQHHEGWPPA